MRFSIFLLLCVRPWLISSSIPATSVRITFNNRARFESPSGRRLHVDILVVVRCDGRGTPTVFYIAKRRDGDQIFLTDRAVSGRLDPVVHDEMAECIWRLLRLVGDRQELLSTSPYTT